MFQLLAAPPLRRLGKMVVQSCPRIYSRKVTFVIVLAVDVLDRLHAWLSSLSSPMSNISISATSGSPPPTDASGHTVPLPSGSSSPPNNPGLPGPGSSGRTASNSHRRNTLVIICAAIDTLLGLAIAGIIAFLLYRKRRTRGDGRNPSLSPFHVDPRQSGSTPTDDLKVALHPPPSQSLEKEGRCFTRQIRVPLL